MTDDIHSCSYHCDRPACIKQQRDELRELQGRELEAFERGRQQGMEQQRALCRLAQTSQEIDPTMSTTMQIHAGPVK